MEFEDNQKEQMLANALLDEYVGALLDPAGFIDKAKGVVEGFGDVQREKEEIIKDLLRRGDQSSIEGDMMAGRPGYFPSEQEMHERMRERYSNTPEGRALEDRIIQMKRKYGGLRGV